MAKAIQLIISFNFIISYFTRCVNISVNNAINGSSLISVQKSLFDFNILDQSVVQKIDSLDSQDISKALNFVTDYNYKVSPLINALPLNIERNVIDQYSSGKHNEDINLHIMQLIKKYEYKPERHEVQTSDGYMLTMYRITGNGPAVFLMHGLLCSADDWITAGPQSGIGYLLASEGYDVWLGNARGNKHSRKHVHLSPEDPKFWDFSWDEIGRYDLPAMIDYVLQVTGQPQLKYVGHSQGTTSFFVMCSEKPEYNEKISLMVALSAVAWMSHLKSPLIRLLSPINPLLYNIAKAVGLYEFLPSNALIKTFTNAFCGKQELADIFCNNILSILCGLDYEQVNVTNLPVLFGHMPAGAASKQLVHYGQGVVSHKFQWFDYGKKNIEIYGLMTPPAYPVERITAPVAIFYSHGDWLANIVDVKILKDNLKNVVEFYKVPYENFNHMDFIWAKDVKRLIFRRLLELLDSRK